jgi:hypothetical protein
MVAGGEGEILFSVFALSRCLVNPLTIDETDASHNIYLTSSAQFGLSLAGGQKGK